MSNPCVSVIICSHNRARLLDRALTSLETQTLPRDSFEIVVVNDGSTDLTQEIVQWKQKKNPQIKLVSLQENIGLAGARNIGILEARAESLLFMDDDCIAEEHWVENMARSLDRNQIVAGRIESHTDHYVKLCHNIAEFYEFMSGAGSSEKPFIAGANMGLKRSVLQNLQGFFKNQHVADDTEMILRARQRGYKVVFEPTATVIHDPDRVRMRQVFGYSYKHARHTILLRIKHGNLLKTPFILKSPALLILFSPIISLKVVGDIYSRNSGLRRHLSTLPVVYSLKIAWCLGAAKGLKDRAMRFQSSSAEPSSRPEICS